jgi:class 3 adenylate cyclase
MRTAQSLFDRAAAGRRHVAVLFVDLSGFTALVESVQPETVYERVRPIMDELIWLVEDHGGDVQQVLGDGFMSAFGLTSNAGPGDVVTRAVRAGVALVRAGSAIPGGLPVHAGVEAGEVLVSPAWEPARFALWGRPVTVAKRLCDTAAAGTLNIGPSARDLCGRSALLDIEAPAATVRARLKGIAGEIIVQSIACCQAPATICAVPA